ncbi:NUDIX hydrolase [Acuticoccus sp. MNP-M23]|uniref:NUDIX hydrolase n=1 Tax=Acuticoccus sp. MNP-M23 TaxID=3072793 RepID=UPI002815BE2E|nr:NUDIX hydrolase [Acuticoccus sp. MNP-M23]WMS42734.1 NUDIX hydrolase [Acuticoccus sp. MNP-M23]
MSGAETLSGRVSDAERNQKHPTMRPRDAASLIVYDPDGPRVLMGRRSMRHTFMPGRYVFPGGRVDATDARVPVASSFHEDTHRQLAAHAGARHRPARARAFGIAALRETFEETGVLIARPQADAVPRSKPFAGFAERGLSLDLSRLAFIARAVTPPGRPRRYDTRFFLAWRDTIADIDPAVVGADAELEDIAWVPIHEAKAMPLPAITLTVLDDLEHRLAEDPALQPGGSVPFYRWERTGFTRTIL